MRTIVQTILMFSCCCIAISAFAQTQNDIVHPGFYMGVEVGYSNVSYKNNFAPGYTATSVSRSGLGTRIEAGFDIWKNFGVLMSVVYFDKPEFHHINNITNSKIKNNLIYLALKGMLPIKNRFAFYADAGVGYIARSSVIVNGVTVLSNREVVRPVYGLGAAYLIWKRWIVTLDWVQALREPSQHLPTSNFVGAGIRYKFAS